jgi:dTDP-glucose pyrophosphorylase
MKNWKNTLVNADATIREAILIIDTSGLQIALVVDKDLRLLGTVTDGDVRRGILRDKSLDSDVKEIMNTNPKTATIDDTREMVLQRMTNASLHHIPIVDQSGKVINIELLEDLIEVPKHENEVVLIAGGMGTRLRPLTDNFPKPLLKVGTKPILEIIIDNFIEYGFNRFTVSVNYRSDLIEEHFGDGSKWGVKIKYIHETKRMGTAGALSMMDHQPEMPFFVMNADLLTKINFHQLLAFHKEQKAAATMCVRQYEYQVPYGVVNINDHQLVNIEEKPVHHFFINAGIYVLDPQVLKYIPKDEYFDMPQLFEKIVADQKQAAVFPIREYWLDIGQKHDFDKANNEFEGIFG